MVTHLPQFLRELGLQQARFVAQHEVFERVEHGRLHLGDQRVLREQQRQFLLEHEHTGRHRRHDVVALVHQRGELRHIHLHQLFHSLQVTEFELRHAAAFFFLRQRDGYAVVFKHLDEIGVDIRFVTVAVASGEQRHLASSSCRRRGRQYRFHTARVLLAEGVAVVLGHRRVFVHAQHLLQHLAAQRRFVHRVDHFGHHRNTGEVADGVRVA